MVLPNPRNGFVPRPGQLVRVVGACHPKSLGKVHTVEQVGVGWAQTGHYDKTLKSWVSTSGELGGLEPADEWEKEIETAKRRTEIRMRLDRFLQNMHAYLKRRHGAGISVVAVTQEMAKKHRISMTQLDTLEPKGPWADDVKGCEAAINYALQVRFGVTPETTVRIVSDTGLLLNL